MKLHSTERPNPLEPQLPLSVGSTFETSGKRSKKRRNKSKKTPLIEKKFNAAHQAIETVIRQNEVRLIWDRDATETEKPALKPAREKRTEIAEKVAEAATVEAIIDHAKIEKPKPQGTEKKTSAPAPEKQSTPKVAAPQSEKVQPTTEKIESTPEAFDELLDNLTAERKAMAAEPASMAQKNVAEPPHADMPPAFGTQEVPIGPSRTSRLEPPSYRHFFWNEPSIISPAEALAERTTLPPINQQESAPMSMTADRTYVEAHAKQHQRSAEAKTHDQKSEEFSRQALESQATQPEYANSTAEVENQLPFLEAVPLHDMGELQFPERMPGASTIKPEFASETAPQPTPTQETPAAQETAQPQQDLGLPELIRLSKKVTIDGVKLHEIYSAKRIDEAGLRAVIQEFLRGGNVRKQLTDEIVNKEKSFERDPGTRHLTSDQVRDKLAGASVKVIQKSYQLGKTSKKVTREATQVLKSAASQAHQELQNSGIDIHWPSVGAIAIIYTLIIILLIA